MKKSTMILAAAGLACVAFQASAQTCSGSAGKATISAGTFIKTSFQTPCSANVIMYYGETGSAAYGAAGSSKGACIQLGHSDAGVRAKTTTCSATSPDWTGTWANTNVVAADASALGSTQ